MTALCLPVAQVTDKRNEAIDELSDLIGVAIPTPLAGTERVPDRLAIDTQKLKDYMDRELGLSGSGRSVVCN